MQLQAANVPQAELEYFSSLIFPEWADQSGVEGGIYSCLEIKATTQDSKGNYGVTDTHMPIKMSFNTLIWHPSHLLLREDWQVFHMKKVVRQIQR